MKIRAYHFLIFFLILRLIVGIIVTFETPLWAAYHHEIDTYNVVQIMLQEGRLPIPEDYPPGEYEIRQGSQPPLYGLLAMPVVALFGDKGRASFEYQDSPFCVGGDSLLTGVLPDRSFNFPPSGHSAGGYAFRMLNVVYALLAMVFTYVAARALFPGNVLIALAAALFVGFEPYHVLLASTIINDNLLLMLASLNLVFVARVLRSDSIRWLDVLGLLITALMAALAKLNGWVVLGITVLLLMYVLLRNYGVRKLSHKQITRLVLAILGVLAVIIGIVVFNLLVFGSLFGRYNNLSTLLVSVLSNPRNVLWTVGQTLAFTLRDYTEAIRAIPLPQRAIWLYQIGTIAALASVVLSMTVMIWQRNRSTLTKYGFLLLLILGSFALVLMRNLISQSGYTIESIVFAPLRYYAAGIPALAVLLSASLATLIPGPFERRNLLGFALGFLWVILSLLSAYLYEPGQILRSNRVASAQIPDWPTIESEPIQVSYDFVPTADAVTLRLYMQTQEALDTNYLGEVELIGANGASFLCQFTPSRGIYPTTRWEPGEIIRDQIDVRNCGLPLEAPVDMSFRWAGTETNLLDVTLDQPIATSSDCPGNLGIVGDELQVTQVISPPTAARDNGYQPLVNWLVLKQPLLSQTRQFTIEPVDGSATYSCSGFEDIHAGTGNRDQFGDLRRSIPRGQLIHVDTCAIYIPADAPTGAYNIYVSLFDVDGKPMPIFLPDGSQAEENRLWLNTVMVE